MKKQFTPDYIRQNKGCYGLSQVNKLSFINKKTINILDILNSEISIKDKCWFLRNKCDLTLQEKIDLSYIIAKSVLIIFKNKYPNDNRVKKCLEGIIDFKNNKISKEELLRLRKDCYAAYADASAAYASADADAYAAASAYAAYAADAAAYAAADADAAAYAYAAASAYAAAYAAYADASAAYASADADAYAYAAASAADAADADAKLTKLQRLITTFKNKVQNKKSYSEILLQDIINYVKSI